MAIVLLFPLAEFWWAYAAFTAFVLLLLALDLGVFHRKAHVVSFRESLGWSILWIVLALVFNYGFYLYAVSHVGPEAGRQAGLEFLTGYIVERSLAIDNIFVFVLVFNYFGVPPVYQHRVLFYGIFGALVFRAAFIAVGAALMQYHAVVLLFGVFLAADRHQAALVTRSGDRAREKPADQAVPPGGSGDARPARLELLREARRRDGTQRRLFVALLFLEISDIIFAVDSVPAIFAVTREPLIVYMSNVFAILGLRAMYFLLADALRRFELLKYALALVLIFVGLKMTWLN